MSESGIFKAAVKLPPDRRAAYLDQACGADARLRAEIESLLHAHDNSGSFLDDVPAAPDPTENYQPIAERPGTVIGPYKLMEQIGEGGFGLVFVAEQQHHIRRKVALNGRSKIAATAPACTRPTYAAPSRLPSSGRPIKQRAP